MHYVKPNYDAETARRIALQATESAVETAHLDALYAETYCEMQKRFLGRLIDNGMLIDEADAWIERATDIFFNRRLTP